MNQNLHFHKHKIDKKRRSEHLGQRPCVFWFTGLSGSGKSTLADLLENALFEKGHKTYLLDGDNVRLGINKDLGFSESDRKENVRRIGELCKLFVDAGFIVLTAFISPFRSDRKFVRDILNADEFYEIYVKADIKTCKERDPKGLYKKALNGEIQNFTGVSSPYEEPLSPDLVIDTASQEHIESVKKLMNFIDNNCDLKKI